MFLLVDNGVVRDNCVDHWRNLLRKMSDIATVAQRLLKFSETARWQSADVLLPVQGRPIPPAASKQSLYEKCVAQLADDERIALVGLIEKMELAFDHRQPRGPAFRHAGS